MSKLHQTGAPTPHASPAHTSATSAGGRRPAAGRSGIDFYEAPGQVPMPAPASLTECLMSPAVVAKGEAALAKADKTLLTDWPDPVPWGAEETAFFDGQETAYYAYNAYLGRILTGVIWLIKQLRRVEARKKPTAWLRETRATAEALYNCAMELWTATNLFGQHAPPPFSPGLITPLGAAIKEAESKLAPQLRAACRTYAQQAISGHLYPQSEDLPPLSRAAFWAICLTLKQSEFVRLFFEPELKAAEARARSEPWKPFTARASKNRLGYLYFDNREAVSFDPDDGRAEERAEERLRDLFDTPVALAAMSHLAALDSESSDEQPVSGGSRNSAWTKTDADGHSDSHPARHVVWLQPTPEALRERLKPLVEGGISTDELSAADRESAEGLFAIGRTLVDMHDELLEGGAGHRAEMLLRSRDALRTFEQRLDDAAPLLKRARQLESLPPALRRSVMGKIAETKSKATSKSKTKVKNKKTDLVESTALRQPSRPTATEDTIDAPASTGTDQAVAVDAAPPLPMVALGRFVFPSHSTARDLERLIDSSWEPGTFRNALESFDYHFNKHVLGRNWSMQWPAEDYARQAKSVIRPYVAKLKEKRPLPREVYADCDIDTNDTVFVLRNPFVRFSPVGKVYTFRPSVQFLDGSPKDF